MHPQIKHVPIAGEQGERCAGGCDPGAAVVESVRERRYLSHGTSVLAEAPPSSPYVPLSAVLSHFCTQLTGLDQSQTKTRCGKCAV